MALPASYNSVNVRGKFVDLAGDPVKGHLTFTPTTPALQAPDDLTTVIGRTLRVELNNTGAFSINLPATDDPDIDPTGFTYTVVEKFDGLTGRTYSISVPISMAGPGIELATAVPSTPTAGLVRAYFLNELGDVDAAGTVGSALTLQDDGTWRATTAVALQADVETAIAESVAAERTLASSTYEAATIVAGPTSVAMQAAFDAVPVGGTVVVPHDLVVTLTDAVTQSGKDFTLLIHGKIVDAITSWSANTTDTTLAGKGALSFGNASVQVVGRGQAVALDGSVGTAFAKPFLYFYDCTDVLVRAVNGKNFTTNAVLGVACNGVTHRDCTYDGGQFLVIWTRGDRTMVDNVTATNCVGNGIVIHDRAYFGDNVLPFRRPQDVKIVNCTVFNTFATDTSAVGITADSCDGVVAHGNDVDGNDAATMGYSWAGSTGLRVYGNRTRNVSTTANGSYTYTGIGMEFDAVTDVEAWGNTFDNCVMGYLILACTRGRFDGVLHSNLSAGSGAGRSCLFQVANTTVASRDLRLSGTADGCAWGLAVEGDVDGLDVDLTTRNVTNRGAGFSSGATIVNINSLRFNFLDDGAGVSGLTVSGVTCPVLPIDRLRYVAASPGADENVVYYAITGGAVMIRNGYIKNIGTALKLNDAVLAQVMLDDIDFVGVTTRALVNATNTSYTNQRLDGVAV